MQLLHGRLLVLTAPPKETASTRATSSSSRMVVWRQTACSTSTAPQTPRLPPMHRRLGIVAMLQLLLLPPLQQQEE
jgi:hypothetical protein